MTYKTIVCLRLQRYLDSFIILGGNKCQFTPDGRRIAEATAGPRIVEMAWSISALARNGR